MHPMPDQWPLPSTRTKAAPRVKQPFPWSLDAKKSLTCCARLPRRPAPSGGGPMVFSCADLERGREGRALDEALCWGDASSCRCDSWPALRARLRCLPPPPSRSLMCKFPGRHLRERNEANALTLRNFLFITIRNHPNHHHP